MARVAKVHHRAQPPDGILSIAPCNLRAYHFINPANKYIQVSSNMIYRVHGKN
jgi:hypothetical protein